MLKDSKVAEKVKDSEVVNTNNGTVDKAKEAIENLKVQLQEHAKKAEYHQTMATKAQGALEVLVQLHPQQEN